MSEPGLQAELADAPPRTEIRILLKIVDMVHKAFLKIVSCVKGCIPHKKRTGEQTAEDIAESALVIASQRNRHNTTQCGLYILPTEILVEIVQYLPLSSALALSVTGTRFYKLIASPVLGNSPTRRTRFEFFTQLESLLGPWNSRPLCGGCLTMHPEGSFWCDQLEVHPTERRCKSTQKLVWLGPKTVVSFDELNAMGTKIRNSGSSLLPREPGGCSIHCSNQNSRNTLFLDHSIDLLRFGYGYLPSLRTVASLLEQFNMPICPHITAADPLVAEIYRKCLLARIPDFAGGWDLCCPVKHCNTFIHFRLDSYTNGPLLGEKLVMNIRRTIDMRRGPEKKGWLSQAIITPDRERYSATWDASWFWKAHFDDYDELRFQLNSPIASTGFPYSSYLLLKQEVEHARIQWKNFEPREDIRALYEPMRHTDNMDLFIRMMNDEATRIREAMHGG